ncbi:hypothetical protein CWI36_3152p0010, partial [Hamiltosporidium magnivora]
MDNKLDILALAETWRDDIDNLNTNYRIVARLLSKKVKKRYSNSEGILILAKKSIYPQIIPSITDFGICIKMNDTLLIFIYKSPAVSAYKIINKIPSKYEGFDVLALGDYNLENSVAYEQIVLEQHAELGLYETKLASFTYKVSHNPILSHLKRLRRSKSANKDAHSVQLLRKEIRRLSKKLKRLGVEEGKRQMKFAELLFNEEELVPVSETKKKIEKFYLGITIVELLDEIKNLKLGKSVCLSGIRNE